MGAGAARGPLKPGVQPGSPAPGETPPPGLCLAATAAQPPRSIPALLDALGHALQQVGLLLVVCKAAALLLPPPPLVRPPASAAHSIALSHRSNAVHPYVGSTAHHEMTKTSARALWLTPPSVGPQMSAAGAPVVMRPTALRVPGPRLHGSHLLRLRGALQQQQRRISLALVLVHAAAPSAPPPFGTSPHRTCMGGDTNGTLRGIGCLLQQPSRYSGCPANTRHLLELCT